MTLGKYRSDRTHAHAHTSLEETPTTSDPILTNNIPAETCHNINLASRRQLQRNASTSEQGTCEQQIIATCLCQSFELSGRRCSNVLHLATLQHRTLGKAHSCRSRTCVPCRTAGQVPCEKHVVSQKTYFTFFQARLRQVTQTEALHNRTAS